MIICCRLTTGCYIHSQSKCVRTGEKELWIITAAQLTFLGSAHSDYYIKLIIFKNSHRFPSL